MSVVDGHVWLVGHRGTPAVILEWTGQEAELVAACRELATPTLIVDGARDIRPRWAVDSLAQALPSVTRVVLSDAGHVPWLDTPDEFFSALYSGKCLP
jgi:pimeloyl-ACP methyl ester carboxylesterase